MAHPKILVATVWDRAWALEVPQFSRAVPANQALERWPPQPGPSPQSASRSSHRPAPHIPLLQPHSVPRDGSEFLPSAHCLEGSAPMNSSLSSWGSHSSTHWEKPAPKPSGPHFSQPLKFSAHALSYLYWVTSLMDAGLPKAPDCRSRTVFGVNFCDPVT